MPIEDQSFIFARHTKRADGTMGLGAKEGDIPSEEYPHVTKEGVEKAKRTARLEFVPMVDSADPDSILFIGGSSEEYRTKETAEIIGNELAEHFKDRNEVKVVTKKEIDNLREEAAKEKSSPFYLINDLVDQNPGKKLIFTYPLSLKQLSLRPHHRDKETGEHTQFSKDIIAKTGTDEKAAVREWFDVAEKSEMVPSPQETAELHIEAIKRLRVFASNFSGKRPVSIGIIAHGWQLDALALYLANNGKVDAESYDKVLQGKPIDQAETGKVIIQKGKATFIYRNKRVSIPRDFL